MLRIDCSSPERGWQPFTDWLSSNGIPPERTVSVSIDDPDAARPVLTATRYVVDDAGYIVVDYSRREACTYERTGVVSGPVPLHPSRSL